MVSQVVEVGLVTILAFWVYLFSPSSLSRGIAALMMLINVAWILADRDRPRSKAVSPAGLPAAPEAADATGTEAATDTEAAAATQPNGDRDAAQRPRII